MSTVPMQSECIGPLCLGLTLHTYTSHLQYSLYTICPYALTLLLLWSTPSVHTLCLLFTPTLCTPSAPTLSRCLYSGLPPLHTRSVYTLRTYSPYTICPYALTLPLLWSTPSRFYPMCAVYLYTIRIVCVPARGASPRGHQPVHRCTCWHHPRWRPRGRRTQRKGPRRQAGWRGVLGSSRR